MRHGWEIKKLGEVCKLFTDGDWIESKDQADKGIRLIQTGNIGCGEFNDKSDHYRYISEETFIRLNCTEIYAGDILISRLPDPIGRSCIIPQIPHRMITAVDCTIVRPENIINPNFLVYYTNSGPYQNEIKRYVMGAVRKRISRKNLFNIPIPVPPLSEQERIVAELDLLSDVIAKKREQLKQLDTLAQSIFYDMFGDPFLMSNAKESVPLGSICVINPHKSELKNIDKNTLCSFVGMAQIGENGELTLEHNRAIKDVYKGFTFFREGDVLFAKITPCMENGKGAIAKRLTNKIGFGSTEFHVIRPNNKITDKYIYYLLSIPSIRKWAESKMTGAGGQRRVPTSFFDELRIILPSLPLQQQFASKIESIEKQKELIKQSLSEVQQLFDSRMDYYFN